MVGSAGDDADLVISVDTTLVVFVVVTEMFSAGIEAVLPVGVVALASMSSDAVKVVYSL